MDKLLINKATDKNTLMALLYDINKGLLKRK